MDSIGYLAAGIFGLGYLLITLEQRFSTHKSAIALTMGGILWMLAALQLNNQPHELQELLTHAGNEIFGIVAFLLAAMALIEILVHYRFFDIIRAKLISLNVGDKQQFLLLMLLTFFLSALLDNISVTIAVLQISCRFFTGKNLIIAAAAIVIAANAGGAWSPLGDITTILLWLADKFTPFEVISYAFLPSFTLFVLATWMMYKKLNDDDFVKREEGDMEKLAASEKVVVATALGSFILPLFMNSIGLAPYIGLLFGLGLTWMAIEFAKSRSRKEHKSHLTANIESLIQTVDLSSIQFIMGILLSVSALGAIGVLSYISNSTLGAAPTESTIIGVNIGIGFLSSVIDNSSLVAVAIDAIPTTNTNLWSLLAITAGTGGSIFLIGSAAGVVASGIVKQLTFQKYLKVATVPALLGLLAAIVVWMLQYFILFS